MSLVHRGDDAGGWQWLPGRGWVWFPPFRPELGSTPHVDAIPGFHPGNCGGLGDPKVDGSWRQWEPGTLVLLFLNALRASLENDSADALIEAIQKPEHAETLARLHKPSCAALEARLSALQVRLREPGADKHSIIQQIRAVLLQMNNALCGG